VSDSRAAGATRVLGLLGVSAAPAGGLRFTGVLTGLPAGTGGWHVHTGYSCAATAAQADVATGGHYFDAAAGADPWDAVCKPSSESRARADAPRHLWLARVPDRTASLAAARLSARDRTRTRACRAR
jgi:hypothetical protein